MTLANVIHPRRHLAPSTACTLTTHNICRSLETAVLSLDLRLQRPQCQTSVEAARHLYTVHAPIAQYLPSLFPAGFVYYRQMWGTRDSYPVGPIYSTRLIRNGKHALLFSAISLSWQRSHTYMPARDSMSVTIQLYTLVTCFLDQYNPFPRAYA